MKGEREGITVGLSRIGNEITTKRRIRAKAHEHMHMPGQVRARLIDHAVQQLQRGGLGRRGSSAKTTPRISTVILEVHRLN